MATQASKKKKVKGKTVNLNDFLSSDGTSSAPGTSYVMANKSWAEQTDEAEEAPIMFTDNKPLPNRAALPTAPRSSQPSELDMSKLPSKPPYTVYLGNIPFDADEEDITSFLRNCNVSQVRLPREGDRLKGFGYAEVEDMDSLMAALALNDQTIRSRRIRVDVAGQGHQDGRDDRTNSDWRSKSGEGNSVFGSGRGSFGGRRNDDPFGSSSGSSDDNWRRQTPADSSSGGAFESRGGGGGRGYEDRGRSGGFGGDRDRGFGNDRGFGGDRDRGFGSFGSSFGGDRGGFEDRGRSGGGFGGDRDRGFGGERDWGDRAGRSRGFENYSEPKDRAFGDRDRDRGYRDRDFGEGRRQYGDAPPGDGNIDSEGPRERKKLVLTKRSDQPSDSAGSKPAPKSTPKSTIFGAAKPVDTAARERAIEERLEREKRLEEQEKMKVEKDREIMVRRERPERPRRESEGEGRTRHSSSSSGKGGPRPIIARRESERSNEDDSAFHKEEPLSPTSPTAPKSPKTPISPRQEDISLQNVVPAPPPKENAWAKRSETVTSPPPPPSAGGGGGSQQAPPSYREGESRPRGDSGRQEPAGHDGSRQYKDAGPPRENPWKRDGKPARKPGDQGGPGMGRRDAYPRTPPGKDDRRDTRCKEDRPARKSPAEMPKYENKPAPNWSQPNKFSCLMADDEPPCSD